MSAATAQPDTSELLARAAAPRPLLERNAAKGGRHAAVSPTVSLEVYGKALLGVAERRHGPGPTPRSPG
jgi:hypothetical protein